MSDADPAGLYTALRGETAKLLGLDLTSLSLVEQLQLDLCAMLRLEIDTLQGECLAGHEIDLARLKSAFEMLRQLLPAAAEPAPVASDDDGGDAQRALLEIIQNYDDANEAEAALAMEREEAVQAADAMAEPPPPPPLPPSPKPSPKTAAEVVPLRPKAQSAHEAWVASTHSPYGGRDTALPPPGSRFSPRDY
jgi:hypothetical protein